MSEMADGFREMREHRRSRNRENRVRRQGEVMKLAAEGYVIEEKGPYQFRVNGRLDVYVTYARWHDISNGDSGSFFKQNVGDFVRRFFGKP